MRIRRAPERREITIPGMLEIAKQVASQHGLAADVEVTAEDAERVEEDAEAAS